MKEVHDKSHYVGNQYRCQDLSEQLCTATLRAEGGVGVGVGAVTVTVLCCCVAHHL